jgi:hypothetical protein
MSGPGNSSPSLRSRRQYHSDGWARQTNKRAQAPQRARRGGGLLVLCRCLHHSIIVGRKKRRNGRGRFSGRCSLRSGRCSLRSGRWHARLLLAALVGALCFPDALGGSDGEGLLCPTRCARRCNSCHHTCGRSAVCCQRVCHRGPKPPIPLVVAADVAVRHGARL